MSFIYVASAVRPQERVRRIEAHGGQAHAIGADSADATAIEAAVAQAVARFGPRAVLLSNQAVLPHLLDGARVITIGSNMKIRTGTAGAGVYQMTKTAVAGLVKGVALDLAPRRSTVNNIQPGPIDTDINAGSLEVLAGRSPLKRVGKPEEIGGLMSYLASEQSGYMTGTSVTMDGGFSL